MIKYKYLIIGGGIAGTTATETIRGLDKDGSIAIISDEPHPLYSRVMLSKPFFVLDKQPAPNIWLKTEEWYKKNGIELLSGKSVVSLDVEKKQVTAGDGGVFEYEKLLLALGAHSRKWDVPGADKKGVFYLRSLDEAKQFATALKGSKKAVVIGSGTVALESIENLRLAGAEVAVVMLEKYFWEPMLSEEGSRIIEKALEKNGVKIFRQSQAGEVLGGQAVEGIILKSGEKIECDLILCGIGVIYPIEWVKTSGIKVSRGIVANEYLETNKPDVWAAGDIAEFNDIVLHEQYQAGNWMNAREQGRIAGLNMAGEKQEFKMVSFCTSEAFGTNIAFAGDFRMLPGRTSVGRGSGNSGSHARIVIQDGKILGASLVNMTKELGTIVKLIQSRIDVSKNLDQLANPGSDLKKLLPN